MLHAHLLLAPDAPFANELRHCLNHELVRLSVAPDVKPDASFEVLVAGRPTSAQLAASPALRAVIIPFAGVPKVLRETLESRPGLAVHNLHHNAAPTAELAIGLMLAAARAIPALDRQFRRHDWAARDAARDGMLLAGRTALIVGAGALGRRVAEVCRALGMATVGVRRRPADGAADGPFDELHGADALHRLLPRADVLHLCAPETADTRGMIGADELAMLPQPGVLVNVGRAALVDEHALHRALASRQLAGAGLDVWYRYPAPDDPRQGFAPSEAAFHELDNVVLSPHRGGISDRTEKLRAGHLAESLHAAARGEPIPNPVDLTLGY